MSARCILSTAAALAIVASTAAVTSAQTVTRGESYAIARAKGPIVIDGNLSDEGWRDADDAGILAQRIGIHAELERCLSSADPRLVHSSSLPCSVERRRTVSVTQ